MRFDSCHPVVNFIFFAASVTFTVWFDHPVFLAISYAAAFLYSGKLNGRRGLLFDVCLLPCVGIYAWGYSRYTHFGVTVIGENFAGNDITLESVVYGGVTGFTAAAVIMWMSCVFAVISSDKVIYLFGRISPGLSLFLSILFRSVPRIKQAAERIEISQEGLGKGFRQGGLFSRFMNLSRLISAVITWTLEDFIESSRSMKCRGYSLRGRTAFSIYRFDNRDRGFVVTVFFCLTLMMMAVMFDQVTICYDPEIIFNRITPMSYVFYVSYAVFLLMPMSLQTAGEWKFHRSRDAI